MFAYYIDLAVRSLKRNKALTALMVLAIALGIGASMTTLTVLHALSGDPLPGRSGQLYYPQIDPRDMNGYQPGGEPPGQVSWIDGTNLLRAKRARRDSRSKARRCADRSRSTTNTVPRKRRFGRPRIGACRKSRTRCPSAVPLRTRAFICSMPSAA